MSAFSRLPHVAATSRFFFRCKICLSSMAADLPNDRLQRSPEEPARNFLREAPRCAACSGSLELMGRVQPADMDKRARLQKETVRCACDARCTAATGPECNCVCGGANHGTLRLVTVTRDAGALPTLRPIDVAKSQAIASEWNDELVAALDRVDRAERAWREGAGPQARHTPSHIYWAKRSISKARELRTQASRLKALRLVLPPTLQLLK